jgi:hypothetical protein
MSSPLTARLERGSLAPRALLGHSEHEDAGRPESARDLGVARPRVFALLQGLLLRHGVFGEIDIDGYTRAAATPLDRPPWEQC